VRIHSNKINNDIILAYHINFIINHHLHYTVFYQILQVRVLCYTVNMKIISKSEYMMFLKQPAYLWIKKHDPEKIPPVDAQTQSMFDNGNLFEDYAEKRFDNPTVLGFSDYKEYASLPARTKEAITSGAKTLFQARFEKDGYTCISDVIEMTGKKSLDLYEIKSSTGVKPEHLYDLAFQKMTIESLGYTVGKVSVIYLNSEFVRHGEIDPNELSVEEDVTERVNDLANFTLENAPKALAVANSSEMPDPSPSLCQLGSFGEYMGVFRNIKKIPEDSIYDLVRVGTKRVGQFEKLGIEKIADIPEDFDGLTVGQIDQIVVTKTGEPIIEQDEIKEFLDSFEYPLYFLDYETYSCVIPFFDGQRPYQQVPFQYSLHVIREPGGEVEHYEYLHDANSNPIIPLSETLKSQIGDTGTVLAWNMGFEKSCNTKMGESHPEFAEFYAAVNERVNDLDIPFANNWYVDERFHGSFSIKKVLPVLVPELSYKELEINNGGAAQTTWMKAYFDNDPTIDKDWLRENMLKYCGLDTWAMVEIYNKLKEIK
jgi:hypothetical protein